MTDPVLSLWRSPRWTCGRAEAIARPEIVVEDTEMREGKKRVRVDLGSSDGRVILLAKRKRLAESGVRL